MIPYASFLYFGVSLYVILPSLALGAVKRFTQAIIVLATLVMLVIQFGTLQNITSQVVISGFWLVIGYALVQWLVSMAFLAVRHRGENRWAYYGALLVGLAPLVAVKLTPLFSTNFLIGFLGISYVTFRTLDVIICIQDELIQSLPPFQYFAFLLFWPTISSGPVDRYRRFAVDWLHQRTRQELFQDLDAGVQRIFTGLLYKFILAALIQQYWLEPMAKGTQLSHILAYMYGYSFYLFFDFAGYSAFAIGFGYLFGIHSPENFNRPFIAHNIRDFWNRWHMSLSFWFRDHIYSRFVFASLKEKWFKNKYLASYLGFFISMGLMGLWHGIAWNYVVYGLYHGLLLAGHDWFSRWNRQHKLLGGEGLLWQAASILLTFNAVCFGLLIFSGRLG